MSKLQFWKEPSGRASSGKVDLGAPRKRRGVVPEEDDETTAASPRRDAAPGGIGSRAAASAPPSGAAPAQPEPAARREVDVTVPTFVERPTNLAQGYIFSNIPFFASRAHMMPTPFTCIDRAALALLNGFGSTMTQTSYVASDTYGAFGKPFVNGHFLITHGPAHLHTNRRRISAPDSNKQSNNLALASNSIVGAPIYLIAGESVTLSYRSSRTNLDPQDDGIFFTTDCVGGNGFTAENVIDQNQLLNYPSTVPNIAPHPLANTDRILRDDCRTINVLKDWCAFPQLYLVESGAGWTGLRVEVLLPGERCQGCRPT